MRALALLALSGCSIIATKSVAQVGPEKCTTSVAPAGVDTGIVVGAIAFAAYSTLEMEDVKHITIPASISALVVFGISAGVGYTRVSRCKQARIVNGIAY
jgi:hypothetical protein